MDMMILLREAVEEIGHYLGLEHPYTIGAYNLLGLADAGLCSPEELLPLVAEIADIAGIMP